MRQSGPAGPGRAGPTAPGVPRAAAAPPGVPRAAGGAGPSRCGGRDGGGAAAGLRVQPGVRGPLRLPLQSAQAGQRRAGAGRRGVCVWGVTGRDGPGLAGDPGVRAGGGSGEAAGAWDRGGVRGACGKGQRQRRGAPGPGQEGGEEPPLPVHRLRQGRGRGAGAAPRHRRKLPAPRPGRAAAAGPGCGRSRRSGTAGRSSGPFERAEPCGRGCCALPPAAELLSRPCALLQASMVHSLIEAYSLLDQMK